MINILIVEDEPQLVGILEYLLKNEGYNTLKAYDGQEALKLIKINKPDLVLLDIMIPKIDGFQICNYIKKNTNIPVIILSAKKEDEDKIVGLELGAEDYICKPFQVEKLALTVERTLRKRKLQIKNTRDKQSLEETIPPVIKDKVLSRLNSIETPLELKNAINIYNGKPIWNTLSAKRILDARAELGSFKELQEVAVLRGIGPKRFNVIMNALSQ